ncbi:hypothetical protein [Alkalihalobacterium elongatum]|uniref:hypothetical protein n=1 Tax=Alkalihalobacterium elongatum TaxID=2675466 RepID=UPI001C1F5787|nr:hypothetical protein [Alkalihalobacterium elongatum]
MFEITFDIPVIWLLLGVSMVYITAALSHKAVRWQFQQKNFVRSDDIDSQVQEVTSPLLIVPSFLILKRKIPSLHDGNSKNDDEVTPFLLLSK